MSLHEHMKGLLVSRSAVEQEEEIAFAACDTDQAEGLTWQEVEQCEVSRCRQRTMTNTKTPTKTKTKTTILLLIAIHCQVWKD